MFLLILFQSTSNQSNIYYINIYNQGVLHNNDYEGLLVFTQYIVEGLFFLICVTNLIISFLKANEWDIDDELQT